MERLSRDYQGICYALEWNRRQGTISDDLESACHRAFKDVCERYPGVLKALPDDFNKGDYKLLRFEPSEEGAQVLRAGLQKMLEASVAGGYPQLARMVANRTDDVFDTFIRDVARDVLRSQPAEPPGPPQPAPHRGRS